MTVTQVIWHILGPPPDLELLKMLEDEHTAVVAAHAKAVADLRAAQDAARMAGALLEACDARLRGVRADQTHRDRLRQVLLDAVSSGRTLVMEEDGEGLGQVKYSEAKAVLLTGKGSRRRKGFILSKETLSLAYSGVYPRWVNLVHRGSGVWGRYVVEYLDVNLEADPPAPGGAP